MPSAASGRCERMYVMHSSGNCTSDMRSCSASCPVDELIGRRHLVASQSSHASRPRQPPCGPPPPSAAGGRTAKISG
eukprot:scaffold151883_cov28-Tisochrysis_lutea.AAC.1